VVDLLVWEGCASLDRFVFRGPHGRLVRRQREWLSPATGPTTAV
jgi:hypothetical protein